MTYVWFDALINYISFAGYRAGPEATPRIEARTTVAIPALSKTWASTLTVRVHSGQTGVRTTTSTPSSLSWAATCGPVSRRIVATSSG